MWGVLDKEIKVASDEVVDFSEFISEKDIVLVKPNPYGVVIP